MSSRSMSLRGIITPKMGRSASVSTLRIMDFSFSSKCVLSADAPPSPASRLSRMPIMPSTFSAVRCRHELLI